jgi:hypothetical protein
MIFLSMKFVVASFPVVDFFLQREMGLCMNEEVMFLPFQNGSSWAERVRDNLVHTSCTPYLERVLYCTVV